MTDALKARKAYSLICPLTFQLPLDPVKAEDGQIYERAALKKHFEACGPKQIRSPLTKRPMRDTISSTLLETHSTIKALIKDGFLRGDLARKWEQKCQANQEFLRFYKSAKAGNTLCMLCMVKCYEMGLQDIAMDKEEAYRWCKLAHRAGNVDGTFLLGCKLRKGSGVTRDVILGLLYIDIAAQRGSTNALFFLGMDLAINKSMYLRDTRNEAILLLQKALRNDEQRPYQDTWKLSQCHKDKARSALNTLLRTG